MRYCFSNGLYLLSRLVELLHGDSGLDEFYGLVDRLRDVDWGHASVVHGIDGEEEFADGLVVDKLPHKCEAVLLCLIFRPRSKPEIVVYDDDLDPSGYHRNSCCP